jgi:thioredoxin reductase (NADPH)
MSERVLNNPKITVEWNTVPIEAKGDDGLNTIVLKDTDSLKTREMKGKFENNHILVAGLFYAIGHTPNTKFLKSVDGSDTFQCNVDNQGYIVVQPGTSLTSVDGVFACGDVQDKK